MAIKKDGIKLSNLYLRDGNLNWNSIADAYIGDILTEGGKPSSATIKSWLRSLPETFGDQDGFKPENFRFVYDDQQKKLTAQYNKNGEWQTVYNNQNVYLSNYDIDVVTLDERDGPQGAGDYLIFSENINGTIVEKKEKLPETGSFIVENGIGKHTGSIGQISGSGGTYTGDSNTIQITGNRIGLKTKSQTPTETIDQNLNFGSNFAPVVDIGVDAYGRVESVTKKNYKLFDAESFIANEAVLDAIRTIVDEEIAKVINVTSG